MNEFQIPKIFLDLMAKSDLRGPVLFLGSTVSKILQDNKMPFFPDYTDHGATHVNSTLATAADLIPKEVLDLGILSDADVAVLVSATLLHDLALHLHDNGFLDLVEGRTAHQPVSWFSVSQREFPWPEEWKRFLHTAKRFSDEELSLIYGPCPAKETDSWIVRIPPSDPRDWNKYDRFLVGEFVRRHHSRLAHEIALSGFPGLSQKENTAFRLFEDYCDLIGVTARSHGYPLRVSLEYIRSRYGGNLRPLRTIPLYGMALLRVADLLQIDKKRAPAALLDLRSPQSGASLNEWRKHDTVVDVSFSHIDPEAVYIQVGNRHSLQTHLQLVNLIQYLQREMDLSSAVLSEVYGSLRDGQFHQLRLSKSRVCSNIESPDFKDQLDYVPIAARFRVDPNLLVLLVEPLYGSAPGIAIRELIQNSIDAVRERRRYCDNHALNVKSLDFIKQGSDVVVSLEKDVSGIWYLRCSDTGIGMDLETATDYFLRAGASYKHNPDWRKEFADDSGNSIVTKSGRFGIGVFAVFLIGNEFTVETRPIKDTTGNGFAFSARNNQDIIEIKRRQLPIGTSICVTLRDGIGEELFQAAKTESYRYQGEEEDLTDFEGDHADLTDLEDNEEDDNFEETRCEWDWYTMGFPKVSRQVVLSNGKRTNLKQSVTGPSEFDEISTVEWHSFEGAGMKVLWTYSKEFPRLTCNGIVVRNAEIEWVPGSSSTRHLKCPRIAVLDPDSRLPLTLDRSCLTRSKAGFEDELLSDVEADFLAFLLASAPMQWQSQGKRLAHPLELQRLGDDPFQIEPLTWVSSERGTFPFIPSLVRLIKPKLIILYGAPGSELFSPVLTIGPTTFLSPMIVRPTGIEPVLARLTNLRQVGDLVGLKRLAGVRLLIFSDTEYLSFDHDALCTQQYRGNVTGRHVHEIEVGICQSCAIDADFGKIVELTFRRGLMAVIAELYPLPKAPIKPEDDRVAKMWLDVVGGPVLAYDPRERANAFSRAKLLPAVGQYLDRWMTELVRDAAKASKR